MAELITLSVTLATAVTLGPGALAPADAGCLERVEMTRLTNGYGLDELGGPGVVRLAVADCEHLGKHGVAVVEGVGDVPVYVVDCQQPEHEPLSDRGLVADVQPGWGLGHREAVLILWPNETQ